MEDERNWVIRHPVYAILIGLLIIFLGFFMYVIEMTNMRSPLTEDLIITKNKTNEYWDGNYLIRKTDACEMIQDFVRDRLKVPNTAKFPYNYKANVIYEGNRTYLIHSYVDSRNSFGVMMRTDYSIRLVHSGRKEWTLKWLEFK